MNLVIVGAQWGDEGKGKIVDLYSSKAELIVRYQGGNNAGHTLVVNGKKTVLHLVPSGILHPGKLCLISNGVVFDPENFFQEIESLIASGGIVGKPEDRIKVSDRAHVILPYHRRLDQIREHRAEKEKLGTTVRGIGPAYEDKVARRGIRVGDLLRKESLKAKLERAIEEKNILFKALADESPIDLDSLYENCVKLGERLRPFVSDVQQVLIEAIQKDRDILFEGAQGTLLDIDHGTYPFVTSSNTVTGGALTGTGVGPNGFKEVIGIAKAYTTRVGSGPFPTEIEETEPELAHKIRDIGKEFGATTGRMRRIGWLDLVALRYAAQVNGFTGIALMKADVLNGIMELKVATHYELNGKKIDQFPADSEELSKLKPVYETVPGWAPYDASKIDQFEHLPESLKSYIQKIEKTVGVPVVLLSTGPGREETLQIRNPFSKI
jgi:adenylosuccinate synthase